MFFKHSQNSLEKICMGVSFLIKLQLASLQLYQERRSINLFSGEFLKNIFFIEPLRTAASVRLEAFLVSSKILYLPFFHQSWSLTFFNYSEVDVMKSNEACIVLKSSITLPLVLNINLCLQIKRTFCILIINILSISYIISFN